MALEARFRRRRLALTSLIDVIFLLLLFFMLSSTFSKFSAIELSAAGSGRAVPAPETSPVFIRLGADSLRINAREATIADLPGLLREATPNSARRILVSAGEGVSAQRLADLLVALGGVAGLDVLVLEPS